MANFKQVLSFMQKQDHNGDWLNADLSESDYVLETLQAWLEDGLELTEDVKKHTAYLKTLRK